MKRRIIWFMIGALFAGGALGLWARENLQESQEEQARINTAAAAELAQAQAAVATLEDTLENGVARVDTFKLYIRAKVERADAEHVEALAASVDVDSLVGLVPDSTLRVAIVGSLGTERNRRDDEVVSLRQALMNCDLAIAELEAALTQEMDSIVKLKDVEIAALQRANTDLNAEVDRLQGQIYPSFGKRLFRTARNAAITIAVWEGAKAVVREVQGEDEVRVVVCTDPEVCN